MDILTCLVVVSVGYGVLYFFDVFFKTCAHYPYLQFLKGTGFEVKPLQIRWTTTAFNRWFLRIGSANSKFWNIWFTLGLYTGLILLPTAIVLLLTSIGQSLLAQTNKNGAENKILDAIIPGVDFPASELGYYAISLLISSVLHEAGHALSAVRDDVHLNNIGLAIFFIFPVAFVNISSDRLAQLNPWRSLRIILAGVWHNLMTAVIAYLFLLGTPTVFSIFFNVNQGISISNINKNSPLLGKKGLNAMDVITKINECEVSNEDSWLNCLAILRHKKPYICAHADFIHTLDESIPLKILPNGVFDCCGVNKPKHICFEYIERNNGVLEIPPHVCLPGRKIIESSVKNCDDNFECPSQMHCLKPMFDNFTNIFKVVRENNDDVIYIGHASDFLRTLTVSSFVPYYVFSSSFVPDAICKLLKYVVVFSLSLALMNVMPCLFLDGEHVIKFLAQIVFAKKGTQTAHTVSLVTCLCGTVILVCYSLYCIVGKILY